MIPIPQLEDERVKGQTLVHEEVVSGMMGQAGGGPLTQAGQLGEAAST